MPMRNFKHITPCLSHNFPQVQSKQSTCDVVLYACDVCEHAHEHDIVVSRRSQLFFLVSRSSWMVFIFYDGYAHVFTETYGWGKPRSMSGHWTGGKTRVGGHETRMKPKPNVDYYLVSYYYYYYYY